MACVLLLCCLTWYLTSSFGTIIGFTSDSASASITQICTSGGYADICCALLDLNINDGHGYGWFIASTVSFMEIEYPSAVTVIYGAAAERPCHTHILKSVRGNRAWQEEIRESGGAGSASVVSTFRPMFLRRRLPDRVLVDDLLYEYVETRAGGVRSFMSRDGGIINGRIIGTTRLYNSLNVTRSAAPLLGALRNSSTN